MRRLIHLLVAATTVAVLVPLSEARGQPFDSVTLTERSPRGARTLVVDADGAEVRHTGAQGLVFEGAAPLEAAEREALEATFEAARVEELPPAVTCDADAVITMTIEAVVAGERFAVDACLQPSYGAQERLGDLVDALIAIEIRIAEQADDEDGSAEAAEPPAEATEAAPARAGRIANASHVNVRREPTWATTSSRSSPKATS